MTTTRDALGIDVQPLSGWVGAEIEGVNLAEPLDDATVARIREALLLWKVVFFRDQQLTNEQHVAFSERLGELTDPHPYSEKPKGFDEINTVNVKGSSGQRFGEVTYEPGRDGAPAPDGRNRHLSPHVGWHADWTNWINPPWFTILRADVIPPFGGDTLWVNTAAVYENFSKSFRTFLDGLWAEHRWSYDYTPTSPDEQLALWLKEGTPVSIHPVVRVHPETGERALFVNPLFTHQIVGLLPNESRKILDLLFDQLNRPEYSVRFRWDPTSLAVWDNRSTVHLIPKDYLHLGFERVLHRTTVVGDVPVGVNGQSSTLVEGREISLS